LAFVLLPRGRREGLKFVVIGLRAALGPSGGRRESRRRGNKARESRREGGPVQRKNETLW